MNRDNAEKIARRIMDRVEQDRALHLDAIVDEIMAGFALIQPMGTPKPVHPKIDEVAKAGAGIGRYKGWAEWMSMPETTTTISVDQVPSHSHSSHIYRVYAKMDGDGQLKFSTQVLTELPDNPIKNGQVAAWDGVPLSRELYATVKVTND